MSATQSRAKDLRAGDNLSMIVHKPVALASPAEALRGIAGGDGSAQVVARPPGAGGEL